MHVDQCVLIELPKIADPRGNLTFIEGCRHIPFPIKRVFYLYGVPEGETRGGHAHRTLHQLLVCLAGSFDVLLDDGVRKSEVRLNVPWQALHVPPMIWDTEVNFAPGSVCLVLASDDYVESDYYRDYGEFLAAAAEARAEEE